MVKGWLHGPYCLFNSGTMDTNKGIGIPHIPEPEIPKMPDTWQETAMRLAAHPRFTWLEGMRDDFGNRVNGDYEKGNFPDLTDWGTVGVMLGMVVDELGTMRDLTMDIDLARPTKRFWFHMTSASHLPDPKPADWWQHPGQALAELLMELWGRPTSGGGR